MHAFVHATFRSPAHRWLWMLLPFVLTMSALIFLPLSPAAAQPTVIYVDAATGNDADDGSTPELAKATIGAGLVEVDPGGTVIIAEGTYAEAVSITKVGVTLQGAGASTIIDGPVATNSGIRLPNANTTNVTIRSLRVQEFTDGGICSIGSGNNNLRIENVETVSNTGGNTCLGGIYINGPISDVTINNVIATNNTSRGIVIWNGFKQRITITNNTVTGNICCGIELQDGTASGVTITGNTVTGNSDSGIGLVGLTSGAGPNVIANNTVIDNGRFGMEIKLPNGTGAETGDGSIVVRDNIVRRTTPATDLRDHGGIVVIRRGFVVGAGNVDIPTGVVVKNNTVSGYRQSSTSDGFGIVVEGLNMHVVNNSLTDNDVGIQIQEGHLPYVPGVSGNDGNQNNLDDTYFGRGNSPVASGVIRHNSVTSNTTGIRNVAVEAADAALPCNWWGAVSGPTTAANPSGGQPLTGEGTYGPWLSYGNDADTNTPGFQLPTALTISAGADTSLAENDYRRLANAIGCVQSGQTVTLDGIFDWAAPNAAADWALGADKIASSIDDYEIVAPANVNSVILTAATPGAATIQGPSGLAGTNNEAFLTFAGSGTNQNWIIENLRIYDVELAIGMLPGAGGPTAYNNTIIRTNDIRVTGGDATGVILSSGTGQRLEGNTLASSAGASVGLNVLADANVTLGDSPNANSFTGFGTAIEAIGGVTAIGNGTTITGGTDGLLVSGTTTSVTLGAAAFSGQSGDYITLLNHPTDLDARTATFEGQLGSALDKTQYAAVQAKITDKNDNPALGLVLLADTQLTVSPTTLDFTAVLGAPVPAAQSFTVSNQFAAGSALDWAVSAPTYGSSASGWLTCTPNSGTGLAGGDSAVVSCSVDSAPLSPGVYTATLTVSSSTPGVVNNSQTVTVTLTVAPLEINLTPASSTIQVGSNGTLTIEINAIQQNDTVITLNSSNPAVATVPATVTIPAGQQSVNVPVAGVTIGGPATITATLPEAVGGGTATAQVRVALVGIVLTPATSTFMVGDSATLTVTISPAQSSDTTVTLASSNPGIASVPATVVVPAGQTSVTVQVGGVAAGGPVTITATLPEAVGSGTSTAEVTVTEAPVPPEGYKLFLPIVMKAPSA